MANPYGMLGLGAPEAMEAAEQQARRQRAMEYARLTPAQQSSYNASNAAQMVGQGMGSLVGQGVGMLTGSDMRDPAQKVRGVQQQMAQALQGVDPSDIDKAYPIMIGILRDNGMVPEAMAMAKEYEDLKQKKATHTRLETKDANDARLRQLRLDQHDPRSALQKNVDGLQALMTKRDQLPEGSPERKNADQAIVRMQEAISKTHYGMVTFNDLGDRVEVVNKEDGNVIRTVLKGNDPNKKSDGDPATEDKVKNTPSNQLSKWGTAVTNVDKFATLSGAFNPRYTGGTLSKIASATGFSDLMLRIEALRGADPEASAWWSNYANLIVRIRHEIFGATLTQGEQTAFDSVRAMVGMPPGTILDRVRGQASDALDELGNQVSAHANGNYNVSNLPERIQQLQARVGGMRGNAVGAAPQSTTRNVAPPMAPAPAAPGLPPGVTVRRVS